MHAQKSKRVGRVGTRIDANDAGAVFGAVISGVVSGANPADASRGCEFEPFDEFARNFARTIISPTRFADFRSSTNVGRSSSNHSPRSDENHPRA